MAPHPIITYSIFPAMLAIFLHPPKTEYEIETKETMQRVQKAIVLKTMCHCNVLSEDKRLLTWVSDARKRHLKVAISQNFPCRAGWGKPPPPPTPPWPCHCVEVALLFILGQGVSADDIFKRKTWFMFPSLTREVKIEITPLIEKRAAEWKYELQMLPAANIWLGA